ncbi:hypothetical protein Tco_1578886 [Tanacetum coccineum]
MSISEASIRSDLLFDNADGIDSLPNQAIFDAIQLIGSKSTSWDQIPTNIATVELENVPVPLDHFPVNTLTSKVFSFMVKKGKHFSGKVTPLFASMLVQPTKDEGAPLEKPSEAQPTPSPPHPSKATVDPQSDPSPRPSPSTTIPDSIPESSGGNHGGQSSSDKSLSGNEGDMTLQSVYDLCISLCTHVSDQAKEIQRLNAHIKSMDEEYLIEAKIGRKEILKEKLDAKGVYLGRTRDVVDEEKENAEDILSTEDVLSTAQQKVSTDMPIVSTDGSKVSTDKEKDSTDRTNEGTDDLTEGGRS